MFSMSIHVVARVTISFLFKAELYFIVGTYYILFLFDREFSWLHFLTTVNNAAVNIVCQYLFEPCF